MHRTGSPFDEPVILFYDVIEVFSSDHLDGNGTSKAFEHFVDGLQARSIGAAFVDDNLPW